MRPLVALFALYPLWWVLGLGSFIWVIAAVPMALRLWMRRRVFVPRGAGLLFLFCGWVVASGVMLTSDPSFGAPSSPSTRVLSFLFRLALYVGALVVLVYVANLPAAGRPRVVRLLGWLWVFTVIGGFLGILFPNVEWASPVERVLPQSLADNPFLRDLVHPGFAQVQNFLGSDEPRPKAPFEYTNEWGGNLALLTPFFVVWVSSMRSRRRQVLGVLALVLSSIPIVFSLNRGLWACLGLAVVYAAVVFLRRGRPNLAIGLSMAATLAVVLVLATPLGGLVTDRLETPHSNARREFLIEAARDGAVESPILGWGSTRPIRGSYNTLAAAPSDECTQCGTPAVGTHGQLWLVLFSQGFVGAALFIAVFGSFLLRSYRVFTPTTVAACISALLFLAVMLIYNGIPSSIYIVLAGMGASWIERKGAV